MYLFTTVLADRRCDYGTFFISCVRLWEWAVGQRSCATAGKIVSESPAFLVRCESPQLASIAKLQCYVVF